MSIPQNFPELFDHFIFSIMYYTKLLLTCLAIHGIITRQNLTYLGDNMYIQSENFGGMNDLRCRKHLNKFNCPKHLHQYAELMLVLDGEIEVTVDEQTQTAKKGQFIFIFPFQSHSFRTPEYACVWNSVFTPLLVADFFSFYSNKVGETAVFDGSEECRNYFSTVLVDKVDMQFFSVKSCIYAALSNFANQVRPVERQKNYSLPSKIVEWLLNNLSQPITLSDVARALGYSENYLSHQISKQFDMNFRSLLNCLRIQKAKEMLLYTQDSIIQISYECGFESLRSFSRAFKQISNTTPSNYRKSAQKKVEIINKSFNQITQLQKNQ